ncbi:MAG: S-layer homology domain-containing protein [Clostridiales Family XIII bacterium]|nr:S-layer homology domain-containing protein [Clostridiales Family XIII bacterium]
MKKKQILHSLAAVIPLAVALLAAPGPVFGADYSDVRAGNWAYEAISAMTERGIVNGFPDGSFRPADTVTYGEFIKMAYIAQGGEERAVESGHWALPYYDASVEKMLFSEHDIAKSRLTEFIPRAYMALVLSRILGEVEIQDYEALRDRLSDVEHGSPREYDIVKAAAYGLITGYPDRSFRPEGTLTRAEAATVIHRLIDERMRRLPDLRPAAEKTPLERLADVPDRGIGTAPLSVVTNASASKRPISEVIDNAADWIPVSDPTYDAHPEWFSGDSGIAFTASDGGAILYYEIFENYPYQMKTVLNLVGNESLAIGYPNASGFLIRDRKVIGTLMSGQTPEGVGTVYISFGESYHAKTFPDFDYIGICPDSSNVLLLIPNNL